MSKNGKKGHHTSVDKELKKSISWLESQPEITKVVLSLCESCRHSYSPGTIRCSRDEVGGLKLIAHGGKGVMNIFVKIEEENKQKFLENLDQRFKK